MDKLVEEVLRLPPGDPTTSLLRAALVWCRLVSDPGFRRRFRWAPAILSLHKIWFSFSTHISKEETIILHLDYFTLCLQYVASKLHWVH